MTDTNGGSPKARLQRIAQRVMVERGLAAEFSPAAMAELDAIQAPAAGAESVRDLRNLSWCSIDNDDTRDLDQLSVAEELGGGAVRLSVAIADVAELVKQGRPLDDHARRNTTSVYTAAQIFPMLPEKLSTDLTSLGFESDRRAIVVEMLFASDGMLEKSDVYAALVRNRAKLAYNRVAAWLDGQSPVPPGIAAVEGLADNIALQVRVAGRMQELRHQQGALSLETVEARPVFDGAAVKDLEVESKNRAKNLIEDLMIASNGVTARYLEAKTFPSIRRVVREPKHWDRIVELAAERRTKLPPTPDARALERFLIAAKVADPLHYPDLSLCVIKLLGAGEYVLELPGGNTPGHFGLAVRDYAHSTAPNRRFPDLITQRLLKAALAGRPVPYSNAELEALAKHCTEQEDAAKKVERQVLKSAAAILLESKIGARFEAIVTGAADKGTWVRIIQPPVEGKLVGGFEGKQVGATLRVELVHVDVERGYIDFRSVR